MSQTPDCMSSVRTTRKQYSYLAVRLGWSTIPTTSQAFPLQSQNERIRGMPQPALELGDSASARNHHPHRIFRSRMPCDGNKLFPAPSTALPHGKPKRESSPLDTPKKRKNSCG